MKTILLTPQKIVSFILLISFLTSCNIFHRNSCKKKTKALQEFISDKKMKYKKKSYNSNKIAKCSKKLYVKR